MVKVIFDPYLNRLIPNSMTSRVCLANIGKQMSKLLKC